VALLLVLGVKTSCSIVRPDRRVAVDHVSGKPKLDQTVQAARQLGDKGTGIGGSERAMSAIPVSGSWDRSRGMDHPIRPGIRPGSAPPSRGNAHPDAAEILDHTQAQHDRDRPQLARRSTERLVGGDKAAEALRNRAPIPWATVSSAMS